MSEASLPSVEISFEDPLSDAVTLDSEQMRAGSSQLGAAVTDELGALDFDDVELTASTADRLRTLVKDELEIVDQRVEWVVIPILIATCPNVPDAKVEASWGKSTTTSGSLGLKIFGHSFGANASLKISHAFSIAAGPGETRQLGIKLPFIVDTLAPRHNPDMRTYRVSVGYLGRDPEAVVATITNAPSALVVDRFLVDASGDTASGGLELDRSYTFEAGVKAEFNFGFGSGDDDKSLGTIAIGIERTTEWEISASGALPGGHKYQGEWLLQPAGIVVTLR